VRKLYSIVIIDRFANENWIEAHNTSNTTIIGGWRETFPILLRFRSNVSLDWQSSSLLAFQRAYFIITFFNVSPVQPLLLVADFASHKNSENCTQECHNKTVKVVNIHLTTIHRYVSLSINARDIANIFQHLTLANWQHPE
jgi:hypothetical protein